MGWMDAYHYLRGAAGKLGAATPPRADQDLPLGARIGSLLTLQQTPLIRAGADGSLIVPPEAADCRILAVSQLCLNLAGSLFRYYLATGDQDGNEKFLQLYLDPQGRLAEVMYCTQLARVIPESVADQQAYTGELGAGLGERSYSLWRAQLSDAGWDPQALALVFGDGEELAYWRDGGDPQAAFVAPYTGTETRLDDADGRLGLRQELHFMPYARRLRGGGSESLLITTEIVHSVNGDASRRGIHVDFVIGIPLEQERIVIQ